MPLLYAKNKPYSNTDYVIVRTDWIGNAWPALRKQLLTQWKRLNPKELDKTHANRHQIALLIENKYGIPFRMVENYLLNFERTMPIAANEK